MMKTFAKTAVGLGALTLVSTSAIAAEKRVPTTLPQLNVGAGLTLPELGGPNHAGERVQVAQRWRRRARRRGARRAYRRGYRAGRRSRGRRVRRGIAIGLGALAIGAIAAGAAHAHHYRGYRGSCGRWLRACENGSYRACRRYDRNC